MRASHLRLGVAHTGRAPIGIAVVVLSGSAGVGLLVARAALSSDPPSRAGVWGPILAGALVASLVAHGLAHVIRRSHVRLLGGGAESSAAHPNAALVAELEHQAFHDPLTGLANRALLTRRIEAALLERPAGGFALVLLDVDEFKTVNDTLGHPAGDELLVEIARRLSRCLRPDDTAARLGGDEFAVLVRTGAGRGGAVAMSDRVLASLRRPFMLSTADVAVRASLGIVVDEPSIAGVDDVLSRADIAMYRAKARGKDRCVVFEPEMHRDVMARRQMRLDLEKALHAGELRVHYQPIVSLTSGEVVGAEALARWPRLAGQMVDPEVFISVAEESGVIVGLGRRVFEEACRQAAAWRHALPDMRINVNLCGRELQALDLTENVVETCARHAIDVRRITFEVTEHVMVGVIGACGALRDLQALGARVAIDDFGAGYSSLANLRDLPVDAIKIGKPFVDLLSRSEDDRVLAASLVGLARSLHLDTVVEGVESRVQADAMRDAGCGSAQGFFYSHPLPAHQFLTCLERRRTDHAILSLTGREAGRSKVAQSRR